MEEYSHRACYSKKVGQIELHQMAAERTFGQQARLISGLAGQVEAGGLVISNLGVASHAGHYIAQFRRDGKLLTTVLTSYTTCARSSTAS